MSLKEQFLSFKEEFDARLENYLEGKIKEGFDINQTSGENLNELLLLVRAGGKRVRPALVYFTSLAGGLVPDESVFNLGMALELFHTFALIHDDIIDESLSRRGFPTMEARYREKFSQQGKTKERSNHLALSATILGGDYAHILANQIVSSLDLQPEVHGKIQNLYYQMQFELCAGQLDDCFGVGQGDWETITEDRILSMLEKKSGNYSIQKPMIMGGILSGMNETQMKVLESAGEDIGLVFQLTDDIIGVFGDEEETGKSTSSDILEGKRNLLFYRTYLACNEKEKHIFTSIVGNPKATHEEVALIKNIMREKGTIDDLYELSQKRIGSAVEQIDKHFDSENPGTKFITSLARYLLERKS